MKIIAGMDSFKGSLMSQEANDAVRKGVHTVFKEAEVRTFPMADGGEGTIDALIEGLNGEIKTANVTGPLGEKTCARYGLVNKDRLAVIEIAEAAGLTLLEENALDPYEATTNGVGELINHAYEAGAREFIIGLGGSATNDGGAGMLQALGFQLADDTGEEIEPGGGALSKIHAINKTPAAKKYEGCRFRVACDVNNVLYGKAGATYIFGPQKGATDEMLQELDAGMKHFADVTKAQLGIDIASVEGGGAAGGLGAAFYGYLDAALESGIGLVIDLLGIEDEIEGAHLVITGEGRLDAQTAMGKVPAGLGAAAKKHDVPVIALGGSVAVDAYAIVHKDIDAIFSIQHSPGSLQEAMAPGTTRWNLEKTVSQIMAVYKISR